MYLKLFLVNLEVNVNFYSVFYMITLSRNDFEIITEYKLDVK